MTISGRYQKDGQELMVVVYPHGVIRHGVRIYDTMNLYRTLFHVSCPSIASARTQALQWLERHGYQPYSPRLAI